MEYWVTKVYFLQNDKALSATENNPYDVIKKVTKTSY